MFLYTVKRLIQGIVTVWFIATATFFAMHGVPGDPLMNDKAVLPEIRANLEARYGLDKPLHEQYWIYLRNMASGDFGISFTQQNREVNDIIAEHFKISATLGILAIVFAAFGGILWGALTALYRNRLPDIAIMFLVILGISVPSFVFAALGQLSLVTVNDWVGFTVLPVAGWGTVQHMIAPSLVLGLGTMAFLTRLMRSSMLEIANSDFVRTARAKGLPVTRILRKHQLRNAILPVITVLGPSIARHHHRRFRGGTGVRDPRPRPVFRAGGAAVRLHGHHGHDGLLRRIPGVHGDRGRRDLRLGRSQGPVGVGDGGKRTFLGTRSCRA